IPYEGFFAHEWFISCDDDRLIGKENEIRDKLDMTIKVLNDDYRVERSAALTGVMVNLLPTQKFYDWMAANGKVGSQTKFPRVLKKELLESWKSFLSSSN
ncbi:MAG TPA: GH3 auxin-responsive promoter, partial [Bacteroidetes bacterium]|nr:GH3 auxin-responsive promoter [Bacteroidota bacterium]